MELMQIREGINKTGSIKKKKENIYITKSWFFKKVNKIDNPLERLTNE